jgi:hypothetical protein
VKCNESQDSYFKWKKLTTVNDLYQIKLK